MRATKTREYFPRPVAAFDGWVSSAAGICEKTGTATNSIPRGGCRMRLGPFWASSIRTIGSGLRRAKQSFRFQILSQGFRQSLVAILRRVPGIGECRVRQGRRRMEGIIRLQHGNMIFLTKVRQQALVRSGHRIRGMDHYQVDSATFAHGNQLAQILHSFGF